ncbi:syntaxin-1A isoform X2 [Parasteatoda tepidariorum]|uniref:syntaxin-1A isoform X2 n=1 Tax=Parasteatoda tepidariorum TaxID=114398 RepID=UPI00077FDDF2|nr:syntaxin-1A isoform X1 [Parasteatoda tepidariorum]
MEEASLALFRQTEEALEEMEKCIEQIRRKYNRILSSPFQDEDDHHELDQLMTQMRGLSAKAWKLIRAAKQNRPKEFAKKCSIRMENVQISCLSQKFMDILGEYSLAQTTYREKRKKLLKKQLEITGENVDDEQLETMLDENRAVFTQDYIIEMERTREDLVEVKERYTEIVKIETSLRELDDMLLSLSILVNNQGEIIDSVEQHIVEASEDVQNGNKEIAKSAKKNRVLCKKKILAIILVLVLITVITIIAVVFSSM